MDKRVIPVIKTDNFYLIYSEKYNFPINEYYFDGVKPEKTYDEEWYKIKELPSEVYKLIQSHKINERYELKNKEMASEDIPLSFDKYDIDDYDGIRGLYEYKYETVESGKQIINVEFKEILEVKNYVEKPVFDYILNVRDKYTYYLKDKDIQHDIMSRILVPTPLMHMVPCKITSKQLLNIMLYHIKANINHEVAEIETGYDSLIVVNKLIKKSEPVSYTYQNIFGRTKKERNKIHHATQTYEKIKVLDFTHKGSHFDGHPTLPDLEARSEVELKQKIDNILAEIMVKINEPIIECPHCKGKGYLNDISKQMLNKMVK